MNQPVDIEEFIKQNGFFMNTIVGVSMYPMLRSKRDTVLIRPHEGRLKNMMFRSITWERNMFCIELLKCYRIPTLFGETIGWIKSTELQMMIY